MKKALVLCGGGSLGAYEMGAWKMFRELNMDFDIITGTSIGAINGAMMAAGEYEKACDLWKEIDVSHVMNNGMNMNSNFVGEIDFRVGSKLRNWLDYYFENQGADIAPFKKLVEKNIDPEKVKNSVKKLGVVAVDLKAGKEKRFLVNDVPTERVLDCLYASSACFPIFPKHVIDGVTYIDGGWLNNMPVDYAMELGADEIVAVMLHSFPPTPQKSEYYKKLPNVTVIEPSLPQGTIMDFTSNRIADNETLGYCDAGKAFDIFWGFAYTFKKDESAKERAHRFYMDILKEGPTYYQNCVKKIKVTNKDVETELDFYLLNLERLAHLYGLSQFKVYDVKEMEDLLKEKILGSTNFPGSKEEAGEKKWLLRLFIAYDPDSRPLNKAKFAHRLDLAFKKAISE